MHFYSKYFAMHFTLNNWHCNLDYITFNAYYTQFKCLIFVCEFRSAGDAEISNKNSVKNRTEPRHYSTSGVSAVGES